jgi:hypothetical protein
MKSHANIQGLLLSGLMLIIILDLI